MRQLLTCVCVLWATAVAAQTPFETLVTARQQYPTPMATAAQVGELLNRVAWAYRAEGMKLLGKAAGANCPMPNGVPISCDYLVHGPTVTGHDVFIDAGPNGLTSPVPFTWGPGPEDLASAVQSGARTLVDPVLPDSANGPVVTPGQPQPPIGGGLEELKRLPVIQQLLAEMRQQMLIDQTATSQQLARIEAKTDEIGATFGGVMRAFGKFFAGPIGAALVTWLTMRGREP